MCIIKHSRNGMYLKEGGSWTRNKSQAVSFDKWMDAEFYCCHIDYSYVVGPNYIYPI